MPVDLTSRLKGKWFHLSSSKFKRCDFLIWSDKFRYFSEIFLIPSVDDNIIRYSYIWSILKYRKYILLRWNWHIEKHENRGTDEQFIVRVFQEYFSAIITIIM